MPLEQIGQSLLWIAGYTDGGNVKTGLAVTVNVWEFIVGGVKARIVNADNATEAGDGLYWYELASGSVDEHAIYVAVFFTAGTADQQDIFADWVVGPTWVENVDAASSTLATAAALATVQADLDNPAQYMADVTALATSAALAVAQADLDNPDQYKADLTGISTLTAAQVWN